MVPCARLLCGFPSNAELCRLGNCYTYCREWMGKSFAVLLYTFCVSVVYTSFGVVGMLSLVADSRAAREKKEHKASACVCVWERRRKMEKPKACCAQAANTNRHLQLVDLQNSLVPHHAVSHCHSRPSRSLSLYPLCAHCLRVCEVSTCVCARNL